MLKDNKFVRRLFGEQFDIQHRLLNIILLVGILGVGFACLNSIIMKQNIYTQIFSFVSLILFIVIFWVANKFKHVQLSVIIFSVVFNNLVLPGLYITSGGIEGGMPLWCLLGFIFPFLLIKGKACISVFIVAITEFILLIIYSYYHPEIIMKMENINLEQMLK